MSRTFLFPQPTHLALQHFSDSVQGGCLRFKTPEPPFAFWPSWPAEKGFRVRGNHRPSAGAEPLELMVKRMEKKSRRLCCVPPFLLSHEECDYRSGGLRWNIDRVCSLTCQEKRQEPDKARSAAGGGREARPTDRREVCGWLLGTEIVLVFHLPQRGICCTAVAFCGAVKAAQEHNWVLVPRNDTIEKKGGFIMREMEWMFWGREDSALPREPDPIGPAVSLGELDGLFVAHVASPG